MRKIFLFWSIILIVLIAGITAIIYGKMLLKMEEEKAEGIIGELSTVVIPKVDTLPAPPSGTETEEMQEENEPPELVLPPEEQQPLPLLTQ